MMYYDIGRRAQACVVVQEVVHQPHDMHQQLLQMLFPPRIEEQAAFPHNHSQPQSQKLHCGAGGVHQPQDMHQQLLQMLLPPRIEESTMFPYHDGHPQ